MPPEPKTEPRMSVFSIGSVQPLNFSIFSHKLGETILRLDFLVLSGCSPQKFETEDSFSCCILRIPDFMRWSRCIQQDLLTLKQGRNTAHDVCQIKSSCRVNPV